MAVSRDEAPDSPTLSPDFARIYEEQLHYVWRLLARFGIPPRDREDVAHDTFLVVHRKLDELDPSRPIRPWLVAISFRVAVAYKRRKMQGEIPTELPELASSSDDAEAAETRRRAFSLLEKLPFEQRVTFVLHELEGFTAPEVAAATATPLNTVYSRLRLARQDLRDLAAHLRDEP